TELYQITFVNENTGWASIGQAGMFKTTNGGLNWVNQPLAPGIPNITRAIFNFIIINQDTIYGAGGDKFLPNNHFTALIWKTTNGGAVWGYQEIDSSYHIGYVIAIDFLDANTGWAFEGNGLKTINGGGIFTGIFHTETYVSNYKLFQNYPNPFNSTSKIKYQILKTTDVQIKVFDIQGREISILVNRKQTPGDYECNFDASNMTSGIYFYQLTADGVMIATKKMIYLK
ncbi:MAG TPA: T9SS type A sorting domain-containing protein, partial [Ignavibacteria bacterium]